VAKEPRAPDSSSIDGVRRQTQRWAAELFARLFVWLGLPVAGLVLVHGLTQGYPSPFLFAQSTTVVAVAFAVIRWRDRDAILQPVLSVGMIIVALAGMLHFGPNFGAALVMATAAMVATMFHGARGAVAVVLVALAGLALNATVLRAVPWARPPALPESLIGWLRLGATTVVMLAGVSWGFHGLVVRMQRAIAAASEATSRVQAAERERETMLQLHASSQRLEAVGRLAGGVSHDVNNALTIVRSGAHALREAELSADERRQILADIDDAARAAASTTRQLLAFSRGLPDDGGPASPHTTIETTGRGLTRMFPEDVRVVTEIEPCPATAMAEGMMTQVLLNLALNARDACEQGGTVTLSCRPADGEVEVRVSDDGSGMDAATRERLFEPFFTTKGEQGTGMGLPMVQAAVAQCGGTIAVESTAGEGTTFSIRLPLAADAPVASAPPADSAPSAQVVAGSPGGRVLLVEDQPQLLRAMSRELTAAGCRVTPTSCVRDARVALCEQRFDLLCTDGILTDGRAHDVIAALLESNSRQAPIMVCSGYLPDELALEDLAKVTFVRKPYAPGELVGAVERLLDS
jgi:signal transduction histidine kinase